MKQHAYIFNTAGQAVALEADVLFDSNGVLTSGFAHTPGTASVTVNEGGVYDIEFSVSAVEPNQFALFVDGLQVIGSLHGSGAGTQQNTGHALVTLPANGVLTLRNHTSAAGVTLQTLAGGTQPNVNASLLIRKIAE